MYRTHNRDQACLEAFEYLRKYPGKNVRGKLVDAFQFWLKIPDEKIVAIKEITSMLHTASLLIDDIEDGSTMRRGVPCAHVIYGIPNTINTANYVYFLAAEKTHCLGSDDARSVFLKEMLNLHRGQGQDIRWRDNCTCPTMDQYNQMVLDKTGGLFRLAVQLMQCFTSTHLDLTPLSDLLARYFQIRDDFINLADADYMESKTFCEDLTEGKFSFVIIHAIKNSPPGDTRIMSILKQRATDINVKKYAVKLMWELGSFHFARKQLRQMHADICSMIKKIGTNEILLMLLSKLDGQLDALLDQKKSPLARQLSSDDMGASDRAEIVRGRPRVDSL